MPSPNMMLSKETAHGIVDFQNVADGSGGNAGSRSVALLCCSIIDYPDRSPHRASCKFGKASGKRSQSIASEDIKGFLPGISSCSFCLGELFYGCRQFCQMAQREFPLFSEENAASHRQAVLQIGRSRVMLKEQLILKMTEFNYGDPKRIQHFTKVYEYAHTIGRLEGLDEESQKILDIAAILHDIGIRPSEEKYGRCNGKLQEQEGPAYAKKMLEDFSEVTPEEIERVCYLIAHHHTYTDVDGEDYRILLEADFLVNAYEDDLSKESICTFREKVFRTKTGMQLLNAMYGLDGIGEK